MQSLAKYGFSYTTGRLRSASSVPVLRLYGSSSAALDQLYPILRRVLIE